jgi:hypothetical protein
MILQQGFAAGGMGFKVDLRCKNPESRMSLMGQSRKKTDVLVSAKSPKCQKP